MIVITTSNSISVKPLGRKRLIFRLLPPNDKARQDGKNHEMGTSGSSTAR